VKTAAAIRTEIIKPPKIAARGRLIPTRSRIAPVTFRIARKSRSQFGSLQFWQLVLFELLGDIGMAHASNEKDRDGNERL
jgi:hypothetical protein